jgi:hypothetical protein
MCQETNHGKQWQQGVTPSFPSPFSFKNNILRQKSETLN